MKVIEEFLARLKDVSDGLEVFESELDGRSAVVRGALERMRGAVDVQADRIEHGGALRRRIDEVVARVQQTTAAWGELMQKEERDAVFINQFDRSVIVMVYGKVNCGKSTLGNFIAGIPFKGVPQNPYAHLQPVFRIHDRSAASEDQEVRARPAESGFPTGGTECTAEIQEFTLGGMSWVDTPGIHSMTGSNQSLARDYVEAAELVIYLTSSDSPGRRSDLDELKRLLDQDKPAMMVVTKFDRVEEDWDDELGDFVSVRHPKPEESRVAQREWLEEEVERAGLARILKDRQYSFLSTWIAQDAVLRGDEAAFEASGMAEFYRQLSGVLSRDALELKQRNPKRKFNKLIDRLLGDSRSDEGAANLANLRAEIARTRDYVKKQRESLLGVAPSVVTTTRGLAMPRLQQRLYEADDRVQAKLGDPALKDDVLQIIAESLNRAFAQSVAIAMHGVMKRAHQSIVDVGEWEVPGLEMLIEEIEVSESVKYRLGGGALGAAGGGLAGAELGVMLGTAVPGIGNVVGGILGGLVGSMVGGFAGKHAGGAIAGTKVIQAEVGTNVEAVLAKLFEQLMEKLESLVHKNMIEVAALHFAPLEEKVGEVDAELREIENELLKQRYDLSARVLQLAD